MQSAALQVYPPELLAPPVARAAYSDRTAWLMATMSKFAYLKFESDEELLNALADRLMTADGKKKVKAEVVAFVSEYLSPRGHEADRLKNELANLGFALVATFNNGGTQAYLAKRDSDRMAVLAFRGTEKNFTDIKTDLNARFYTHDGVKIHDGFRRAFAHIESAVIQAIGELGDYRLYTTGHSLGGALAVVATRTLNGDNVAACYTFGSPKVGSLEFGDAIKPPIYRVVNAADLVPRVPLTWIIEASVVIFKVTKFLPLVGSSIARFLENFRGYSHHGDMRYLSVCDSNFDNLRLIANPELPLRAFWLFSRISQDWNAGFTDHGIDGYCAKLRAYAVGRSKGNVVANVIALTKSNESEPGRSTGRAQ